ncbi:MAG: protealysin inhibitor emfourin [Yersiniaceae bacterium]|uniref:Uncharacterized protein n=1 Tax=Chimaeribacter coloradensis TaxID=2060068 RepID=A0A2N5E2R0_9GAMM|nr:protealysin inhibitor emfourin [Chimaeribacter coloradensis]MDU6412336.1 protealysin inhibitor emfourin [Yersiniaceae bacterium]PLR34838.1 hypothetical protein CYR32_11805 [Chimaeribacter coloradensis]
MQPISELDPDAVIILVREGGFAFIPKLNGPRRIALTEVSAETRDRICRLINQIMPYAQQQPGQAGCGDQRYFRLEIHFTSTDDREWVLLIPETRTPEALVRLWKYGDLDGDGKPDLPPGH